nr:MAG TPA: hypothetical protein [Caudoviricetes sp.]
MFIFITLFISINHLTPLSLYYFNACNSSFSINVISYILQIISCCLRRKKFVTLESPMSLFYFYACAFIFCFPFL